MNLKKKKIKKKLSDEVGEVEVSAPLEVGGEVDAAGGDEVHTSKGGVRWGVTGFSLIAAHL